MGLTRILGFCLSLLSIGESFVEFDKSRLYDETDFTGKGAVNVPLYCSEGCKIYVSVPNDSADIASKIVINAYADGEASLTSVSDKKDANGQKIPFEVKQGNAQVDFINNNAGQKSAPLAVWIVRNDNDFTTSGKDVEVYDAAGTIRNPTPAIFITILEAEPYALTVKNYGAAFDFEATTSGFDSLGEPDKCKRVVESANLEGNFVAEVRSPLLTLNFAESGAAEIGFTALKNSFVNLDQSKATFVTSPGYNGCNVKTGQPGQTKTFRSSLYTATTEYDFTSDKAVSFELRSWMDLDENHPVEIVADDQEPIMWGDAAIGPNDAFPSTSLTAKDLKITWTRNAVNLDKYFMIRVIPEPGDQQKSTTAEPGQSTTAEHVKTTTNEPAQTTEHAHTTTNEPVEPLKTTTNEPVEPVKTTTNEPVEPVKTTSHTEPIQTTSGQQPEPAKSTTTDPVALETTTSASEQEPVKTTTNGAPGPDHEKTTTIDDSGHEHSTAESVTTRRSTATRRTLPTTTFHPKSTHIVIPTTTTTTKTTTTAPSTTSGAGYGALILPIIISSALFIA